MQGGSRYMVPARRSARAAYCRSCTPRRGGLRKRWPAQERGVLGHTVRSARATSRLAADVSRLCLCHNGYQCLYRSVRPMQMPRAEHHGLVEGPRLCRLAAWASPTLLYPSPIYGQRQERDQRLRLPVSTSGDDPGLLWVGPPACTRQAYRKITVCMPSTHRRRTHLWCECVTVCMI
jgi:hypothetical protein